MMQPRSTIDPLVAVTALVVAVVLSLSGIAFPASPQPCVADDSPDVTTDAIRPCPTEEAPTDGGTGG